MVPLLPDFSGLRAEARGHSESTFSVLAATRGLRWSSLRSIQALGRQMSWRVSQDQGGAGGGGGGECGLSTDTMNIPLAPVPTCSLRSPRSLKSPPGFLGPQAY